MSLDKVTKYNLSNNVRTYNLFKRYTLIIVYSDEQLINTSSDSDQSLNSYSFILTKRKHSYY